MERQDEFRAGLLQCLQRRMEDTIQGAVQICQDRSQAKMSHLLTPNSKITLLHLVYRLLDGSTEGCHLGMRLATKRAIPAPEPDMLLLTFCGGSSSAVMLSRT